MRFPSMNKQSRRRVNVPELSGGLNLRDNPTQCNDNQLTELVNMWYKDGTLRTRSGMVKLHSDNFEAEPPENAGQYFTECKVHDDIDRAGADGNTEKLVSVKAEYLSRVDESEPWHTVLFTIHFFWCGKSTTTALPSISCNDEELGNYLVFRHMGTLYCFVKTSLDNYIYKLEYTKDGEVWDIVREEDYYVPIVMTHCKTFGTGIESTFKGTQLEGYNLLTNKYRMIYSTFNENNLEGDNQYHEMIYPLLHNPSAFLNNEFEYKIVAKITDIDGKVYTHSLTVKNFSSIEEEVIGDGLYMNLMGNCVIFRQKITTSNGETSTPVAQVTIDDYVEDNLEITAEFYISETEKNKQLDKIFNMTQAEWFGGASAGLAGGTRLFLCGNTDEDEKALVCWSGLNKPLYFPENSYFYVGDASEAVTGFGKQSDMLVIFKDNETWYTQYYQNTDITAEDLINQSVVDIQASAVYFPLVQINPSIGCPYPDTVQLCRNRLVWLGNGGRVYSLVSGNQYSERSIYAVSEMVQSKLRQEHFTNSVAYDWDGYYCLKTDEHMYLMDYNSYGYIYAASHSKTEDANLRIPWYYWELPENTKLSDTETLLVCDNDIFNVYFSVDDIGSTGINCTVFGFENGKSVDEMINGTVTAIKSILQTKFFDFGEPNSYKNICSVGLSLGYNGGDEITVTFLTDGGEEQTGLVLEDEADERTAGFTKSRILYPAICSAVRFGVRLECEGNMIIDGLNIDYRLLGRAR